MGCEAVNADRAFRDCRRVGHLTRDNIIDNIILYWINIAMRRALVAGRPAHGEAQN
jgi:hypothetical protein